MRNKFRILRHEATLRGIKFGGISQFGCIRLQFRDIVAIESCSHYEMRQILR